MRMTQHFGRTLREPPADAEGAGYRVLQRAGYVRALGPNRYAYLPAGLQSLTQLAAGLTPPPGPERRHVAIELPAFGNEDLEAIATALAASDIQSYRQLPVTATGRGLWRRAHSQGRGGPLNAAEAPAWFAVTLDGTDEAAQAAYDAHQRLFRALCRRSGLGIVAAPDATAPATAHAYLYLTDDGGEPVLLCDACGYSASADAAASSRAPADPEPLRPLEKVATPHAATIADLARFLGVPEARTAKAVFLMAAVEEGERFVFAVVRGDTDVSERKLRAALRTIGVHAGAFRPANDVEIRAAGATPGYASPIGLKNVLLVVDRLAAEAPNLVAGANDAGYHLLNTNHGRDYHASVVADISLAKAGDGCPKCSQTLRAANAALLGQSARVPVGKGGPAYLDATGRSQPVQVAVHQVDLGALLTAIAAERSDEQGLVLPPAAAPFAVHLVAMPGAEVEVDTLYRDLWQAGLPCLLDDRGDSAGVKFTDADLIGAPVRITLGKRALQSGGAEFKRREPATPLGGTASGDRWIVPLDAAVDAVRQALAEVEANAITGVKDLPYGEHLR